MELEVKVKVNEDMTAEELANKVWLAVAKAVAFMGTDNWGDIIILDKIINKLTQEKKKIKL